jgi:hypothetical protein
LCCYCSSFSHRLAPSGLHGLLVLCCYLCNFFWPSLCSLWSSHFVLLHWCNFSSHRLAPHGFLMIFSPCITIVTSLLAITLFMVVFSWSSCLMLMQLPWPSPLSLWYFHFALLIVQLF